MCTVDVRAYIWECRCARVYEFIRVCACVGVYGCIGASVYVCIYYVATPTHPVWCELECEFEGEGWMERSVRIDVTLT